MSVSYFPHASHVALYIVSGSLEESASQSQTIIDSAKEVLGFVISMQCYLVLSK